MSVGCVTISNLDSFSSSETAVNPEIGSWKSSYLIELDVRKPLVVFISQRSEQLRLYNLVKNVKIPNPWLKTASSNSSPRWTVRFLGVMIGDFRKRESIFIYTLKSPTFIFVFTPIVCASVNKLHTKSKIFTELSGPSEKEKKNTAKMRWRSTWNGCYCDQERLIEVECRGLYAQQLKTMPPFQVKFTTLSGTIHQSRAVTGTQKASALRWWSCENFGERELVGNLKRLDQLFLQTSLLAGVTDDVEELSKRLMDRINSFIETFH